MSRQHIRNDNIHREVFNLKYAKPKDKQKSSGNSLFQNSP